MVPVHHTKHLGLNPILLSHYCREIIFYFKETRILAKKSASARINTAINCFT
jgi:hypothetical protein